MSTLAQKTALLKTKTAELTVKEVKLPESSADTLTLFQSNSAPKTATSNEWIIDLFPNQVPTFLFLMTLAIKYSTMIDHKEHPKSSTATVALYLMTVFQAFFLINDMHVRPSPSAHAQSWSQISWKKKFTEFLLTLPVPEEMETIFAQLYATETEKTNNVFVVPSAAGFQHDIFFGRFIPLSLFTHIHDCIATIPGNSPYLAIMNDLLPRELYKLKAPGQNHTFVAFVADILGVTTSGTGNTNAHHAGTKYFQIFKSVFNPVLFRDFHRRSSLATLDLKVPTFKTAYPNAYDVIFNATAMNLSELKIVLQSMASLLQDHVPMKKNLCQLISSASGIAALDHGYSTFAMPTWTSNNQLEDATDHIKKFPTITSLKAQAPHTRAETISFLQPNTKTTPGTTISDAEDSKHANDSTITRHWPFSLVTVASNAAGTVNPKQNAFVTMTEENEHVHTYPRVLVLDVTAGKTITAPLATLTGKIIETFELDGTTIEIPNVDKSLGLQNAMFADSSIPYKYVIRGTRFYVRTSGSIQAPLSRNLTVPSRRLPASSLLHDRTQIRLPSVQLQIIDAPAPTTIPGMIKSENWQWLSAIQSFIGFRTVSSNDNTTTLDNVPGMLVGRLYVWSPYTYTAYEDQENEDLTPDMSESRHYFITNLRTVFGTDVNLTEVVHPLEALPVL